LRRNAGEPDRDELRLRRGQGDLPGPLLSGDHLLAPEAASASAGRHVLILRFLRSRVDPRGKVALLSGGARIGREVALAPARRGGHVAATYTSSRTSAEETARSVRSFGARALVVKADLSRPSGAAGAVRSVHAGLGGPDILVCMASVYAKTPF